LTKILSSGSFYYALHPQWDLSSRVSVRLSRDDDVVKDLGIFDARFVWNEYIIRSLLDFRERLDPHEREDLDHCQFIVSILALVYTASNILRIIRTQILAIQGYVGVFTMALPAPPTDGSPTIAHLSLISRLGWKRAGTRFNTRGVDDDGNTANFVEVSSLIYYATPSLSGCCQTETVFSTDQHCVSYVQVRGSVPCTYLILKYIKPEAKGAYAVLQCSGNSKGFKHLASASR
jgi:hypothetical protein